LSITDESPNRRIFWTIPFDCMGLERVAPVAKFRAGISSTLSKARPVSAPGYEIQSICVAMSNPHIYVGVLKNENQRIGSTSGNEI